VKFAKMGSEQVPQIQRLLAAAGNESRIASNQHHQPLSIGGDDESPAALRRTLDLDHKWTNNNMTEEEQRALLEEESKALQALGPRNHRLWENYDAWQNWTFKRRMSREEKESKDKIAERAVIGKLKRDEAEAMETLAADRTKGDVVTKDSKVERNVDSRQKALLSWVVRR